MNYTTLSSRVPNTRVTTSLGLPDDIGLAPSISGQIPENVSSDGTNDVAPPNPQGRDVIDADGTRPKLLSCRNRILISTFNTRTLLHPPSRLNELVLNAKAQKLISFLFRSIVSSTLTPNWSTTISRTTNLSHLLVGKILSMLP